MARYFFILQWPDHEHTDPHGTPLPDDEAARRYAQRVIRELKDGGGYDGPGLHMLVTDDAGRTIFLIPF